MLSLNTIVKQVAAFSITTCIHVANAIPAEITPPMAENLEVGNTFQSDGISCTSQSQRARFDRMLARDQFFRRAGADSKSEVSIADAQQALDQVNQQELDRYVKNCGWPKLINRFQLEPIHIATIIVLHAPVDFQNKHFSAIERSAKDGETPPLEFARLVDRHRLNSGLGQLYGTQRIVDKNGIHLVQPIDDPEHLNERRKKLFLGAVPGYP